MMELRQIHCSYRVTQLFLETILLESAPVLAGNPGNVIWKANPSQGGTWGYVYTTDNAWRSMGPISLERDLSIFVFDKVGVGTTTPGLNTLQVGSGTSLFAVDGDGVGIGTTANGYALHVIGSVTVSYTHLTLPTKRIV